MRGSKQMRIKYAKTYDFQIKVELFTQCPQEEIYRVVKIVHTSTEKITNFVINQHCLHFKCMKVNNFGKCITKIPNLQPIMVLYRVGTTYIIV